MRGAADNQMPPGKLVDNSGSGRRSKATSLQDEAVRVKLEKYVTVIVTTSPLESADFRQAH
jgi:hypothetical protein